MPWNLFIDDERNPKDVTWAPVETQVKYRDEEWIVCKTNNEVMLAIAEKGMPSYISFDHDLGEDTATGYDIARLLVDIDMDKVIQIPDGFDFYVHSKNVCGAKNIQSYLENYLIFKNSE